MARANPSAAAATARIMWLPMLVRLLALACAVASVLGIVAFFTLDSLHPYRWHLLVGGVIGSALFGWIGDRISPTRGMVTEIRKDLARDRVADQDRKE